MPCSCADRKVRHSHEPVYRTTDLRVVGGAGLSKSKWRRGLLPVSEGQLRYNGAQGLGRRITTPATQMLRVHRQLGARVYGRLRLESGLEYSGVHAYVQ
jgi:hypothetical protein